MGLTIRRSRDEFLRGAADADWLPEIGIRQWVLVSSDRRQSRKPEELSVLKRAKVRAFYFSTATLSADEQVEAFTKALPQIIRAIRKQQPPFVKIIRPGGKVKPVA
jgi:hypothetical protein